MALSLASSNGRVLKRADPTTIQDKFLVGYQGWFTCAGDGPPVGPGHHGWLHWFNYPVPDGGRPNTDLWPDVSEYSPSEMYPAPGLKNANGEQLFLFSSRHPRTVQRHFHWMAQHGVDGAFLQRFAGQTDLEAGNEGIRNQRDEVGDRVREAAEKEGRVFAIMYDVSGVAPDRIQRVIEHDWMHLIHTKCVLDSPNYLRERGKAVVTLWGFGMADSGHDPNTVRAITAFIRNNTPGGAYIMAGTPAHWRTSVSDADPNPDFVKVWLEEFDALSPWTVGRYHNEETADWFERDKIKGDVELINERNEVWQQTGTGRKIDYIPVMFPGGSGHNLSEGKWGWNDAPRQGGRFMWRQLYNVRRHGVRTIYGAMWDEYDEGTAYMPVVPYKTQLPVLHSHRFMALDEDGYDLPSDWYMRICGFAGEGLRSERLIHDTFPAKELQDYWSTRPRYEDDDDEKQASGSGHAKWQSYSDFETSKVVDDVPPPPYSLEAEEASGGSQAHVPHTGGIAAGPPPAHMSTRPNSTSPLSSSSTASTSSSPAPHVNISTRPAVPSPHVITVSDLSRTSSHSHTSSHSAAPVDALSEDFRRQASISASSPGPHPPYSSHPAPQSAYSAPYGPPGPSSFPTPNAGHAHGTSASAPWSQASWPPKEWGVPPTLQAPHVPHRAQADGSMQARPGHRHSASSGYAPSYLPVGAPPPLKPRPSQTPHTPSHSPSHSPSPSLSHSPSFHTHTPYPPPHQPPPRPGSQSPPSVPASPQSPHYGPYQPPAGPPPGHQPFPQPQAPIYPPAAPSSPTYPQNPYGGFSYGPPPPSPAAPAGYYDYPRPPGPPQVYDYPGAARPASAYGSPWAAGPPPPPPRPPGSYAPPAAAPPAQAKPSLSANPVGFAMNVVSEGEARLQSLAQAGSKLWNKRTR